MRSPRVAGLLLSAFVFFFASWGLGQEPTPTNAVVQSTPEELNVHPAAASSFDEVVGRIVEREHYFNERIEKLHPLIETYIQNLKDNDELGAQPVSDQYFLGRLDLAGDLDDRFANRDHRSLLGKLNVLPKLRNLYAMRFLPEGFAQMVLVDDDFGRAYYNFSYVHREFLGEVRCLVIDVQPKKDAGDGRFVGRIWVEDQNYNIVRFNGTYTSRHHFNSYLHFDSWRLNMRPGLWLPAYIYSEESGDRVRMGQTLHFKAQTRLWGYDLPRTGGDSSFTAILVDSPQTVRDQSQAAQDASPVESQRMWEREAEDNAIERLQSEGLIAPDGEVDQVMQTVVNNLIFTNNLNIQPDVRCRVLLTTPLESFTIGHTIVLSRGLLDVLPDEASLAMVLAHELGHIVLGHQLDTRFAFNDRSFFPDQDTFENMDFARDPAEEEAADQKAMQLLANSPYKDKLANAGLFLRSLQAHASELKHLISPHLGNSLANGKAIRMSALLNKAPALEVKQMDQIAALPLGGRIKLDPWTSSIELVKGKPVALANSREKMPFEVTPFFPYLSRLSGTGPEKVALTAPAK
jgi:Peptidase family M48